MCYYCENCDKFFKNKYEIPELHVFYEDVCPKCGAMGDSPLYWVIAKAKKVKNSAKKVLTCHKPSSKIKNIRIKRERN